MASELLRLVLLSEYGASRTHVFPSATSMAWFVRRHRKELADAGALLMITGRWFAHPEKFDAFVLAEGQRAASKQSERPPDR